ncbi:hypothetical protein ACFORL_08150 [Legionella dresdenensis]|uniref:Uncharacterized protein n=1 Tax=Legionella dresdenensis TaxID=450200 RepID=A0ABV8CFH0_9GAMM
MKKFILALALLPAINYANTCSAPWEKINASFKDALMCRMPVPHGWLVQTSYWYTTTTLFVPDENHEWILEPNNAALDNEPNN